MAKKQTKKYYILVFTQDGPKYLTSLDYHTKTAHWDTDEKPYEFSSYESALDIHIGLLWNGHMSVISVAEYDIEHHPYNYKDYEISFKERSKGK